MPTVPDDVRRIWDSEALADFANGNELADQDVFGRIMGEFSDAEIDADYDYRTDTYGEDPRIEVALDGCPFDTDELSDNMVGSGNEAGPEGWDDQFADILLSEL